MAKANGIRMVSPYVLVTCGFYIVTANGLRRLIPCVLHGRMESEHPTLRYQPAFALCSLIGVLVSVGRLRHAFAMMAACSDWPDCVRYNVELAFAFHTLYYTRVCQYIDAQNPLKERVSRIWNEAKTKRRSA